LLACHFQYVAHHGSNPCAIEFSSLIGSVYSFTKLGGDSGKCIRRSYEKNFSMMHGKQLWKSNSDGSAEALCKKEGSEDEIANLFHITL